MSSQAEEPVPSHEPVHKGSGTPDLPSRVPAGKHDTDGRRLVRCTTSKTEKETRPLAGLERRPGDDLARSTARRTGETGQLRKTASSTQDASSTNLVDDPVPRVPAYGTMTVMTSAGNMITTPRIPGFGCSRNRPGMSVVERILQQRATKAAQEKARQKIAEEAQLRGARRRRAEEKKRQAEEKKERARRRREREAREARGRVWYGAMVAEMGALLEDIDWAVVLRTSRALVGSTSRGARHRLREKPPPQDLYWARCAMDMDRATIESMGDYGVRLVDVVRRVDRPDWLEEETVRRNRLKLTALQEKGAQVCEIVGEGRQAADEAQWKLQALDALAQPLAEGLWLAATKRMQETGRVHQDRFLHGNSKLEPCLRCQRMGETCIQIDPGLRDADREGLPRWTKYVASGHGIGKKVAQARAEELLEPRGRAFVNICGLMVDAVDVKSFAPAMVSTLQVESLKARRNQSMAETPRLNSPRLLSPSEESRAEGFRARMAKIRSDEYWAKKAEAAGVGVADWGGGTRGAR
ncbi:uncharacterized protein VDAG_05746 [Verticillium dahliae VdLs.17]|uniref:Uncharacterized protein n=1 Tax=Verticillium dahliae (strain VdLs.17 / ATCC MYA-4575 / FGSC 10137) TaxID=498257 RepID=G2X6G4_VERDV|nr:uncharacterized protein VDAG_05746 [Verticillium dahliae VdLs.17]EGY14582.1 hypothetical protein VDAG_05746 [Verticillium dahliae VdLs.17]KAH6708373.1 hypothetical protein EV126DRAFT_331258 [Verticillium dahliae]